MFPCLPSVEFCLLSFRTGWTPPRRSRSRCAVSVLFQEIMSEVAYEPMPWLVFANCFAIFPHTELTVNPLVVISPQTLRGTLPSRSNSTLQTLPSSPRILPGKTRAPPPPRPLPGACSIYTTLTVVTLLAVLSDALQSYSEEKLCTHASSSADFYFFLECLHESIVAI